MAFWQLIDIIKSGEKQTEVYQSVSSTGTLIKNVTTFYDDATTKVKVLSESMAFVPNTSGGGGNSGPIGNTISSYDEVSGIPSGILQTILSFIAPSSGQTYLYRVEVSGTNAAMYKVYLNGVVMAQKITSIAGPFDATIDLTSGNSAGLLIAPGDLVEVKVIHSRPDDGDFNARLQYVLV